MARIDEAKVTKLMALTEANIEAEIAAERDFARHNIYMPGGPGPKKVDRTLERALSADLSMHEAVEFDRRRRAKAKAYWRAGDDERKNAWGGW